MKKFSKSLILPIAYPVIPVILLIYFFKALNLDLALMRSFIMRESAILLITSIAAIILTIVFTKKFNKSFILPVTYAAIAVLLFIYSLHAFDFYDLAFFTCIFVYLSLLIFAASIEAFILTAVFDLNLKRNFSIYIVSIILSIMFLVICCCFYGLLGLLLGLFLPVFWLVAKSVYILRGVSKSEIIVWLLLDPVLAISITQITVLLLAIFG